LVKIVIYFATLKKKKLKNKIHLRRNAAVTDKAFQNFIGNYYSVAEHNERYRAGNESFQQELNKYSHLSYEDVVGTLTGSLSPSERGAFQVDDSVNDIDKYLGERRRGRFTVPSYWNWNELGYVTPVQEQGQCNSCWAFAALGAIESRSMIKNERNVTNLSVQEVINCPSFGQYIGCNGGWGITTYAHAVSYGGVGSSTDFPYTGKAVNYCYPYRPRVPYSAVSTYSYTNYYVPTDESLIQEWVFTGGPVYMTLHVSADFVNYKSGIYTDPRGYCTASVDNNHAVLCVGYGTENGVDYWIVKNSWGGFIFFSKWREFLTFF
jgi:C1A family cysteine protease